MPETEISNLFGRFSILNANELYLDVANALRFIATCEEYNLAVIGLEVLIYSESRYLKPQLDMIADWSSAEAEDWPRFREVCNKASEEFLRELPQREDFVITVVVYSEVEWDISTKMESGQLTSDGSQR